MIPKPSILKCNTCFIIRSLLCHPNYIMSDSDLQVKLDSDSELPHCNSRFHAHQESPRVLANWFFLPGSPAYQLELAEISPEIADQCMLRANYPQSACHFLVHKILAHCVHEYFFSVNENGNLGFRIHHIQCSHVHK